MITFVEGLLTEALPTQVVIECNGIGYEIFIPLSSYDRLPPPGQRTRLLTHLAIREDAHQLYGFATHEERDLFRLLIHHVTGVGPKAALAILSGMSVAAFKAAVVASDLQALSRINGIGKKTAERIVVELKDRLGVAAEWEAASSQNAPSAQAAAASEAVLALISLGYKQAEAHRAIQTVAKQLDTPLAASSEELIRAALKLLSK